MIDKNYNDIDIFDIKDIKTCEQVREEKLKKKGMWIKNEMGIDSGDILCGYVYN